MRASQAICLALLLACSGLQGAEAQWPCLRGSSAGEASKVSPCPEQIDEWHYSHRGARRYKSGLAVWASPALAIIDGRPMAFVGGYDQTMHALDLTRKSSPWRKLSNGEVQNAPAIGKAGGMDAVFWTSSDRTVYATLAYNGRTVWTKELAEPSSTLGYAELSSPCVMGGSVFVASFVYDKSLARGMQKGMLHRLDRESGELLWSGLVCDGPMSSPVGFERGGRQYIAIAARRGLLQCYDVTGEPVKLWSFQMPHEVLGSPATADLGERTLLYLGSKYGNMVAIDAMTGVQAWSRMAGNWFDNSACAGKIDGRKLLFAGSHDYCVYAMDAASGELVWKRALGGEIHSAPCLFRSDGKDRLAVAALDNHLYLLDAKTGAVENAWHTGDPIWDKLVKGETLWGSPAAFSSDCGGAAIVYGAFNDFVYAIPVEKPCSLTAMARSAKGLWLSMGVAALLFLGVLLPLLIVIPRKDS